MKHIIILLIVILSSLIVNLHRGIDVEIIVQGNLDKIKKTKEFNCLQCGCIFKADNGEYQYAGSQYNESYYSCICPCCGNKVYST